MSKKMYIFALAYTLIMFASIYLTPSSSALLHDAGSYYQLGKNILEQGIFSSFFSFQASFIDRGYPTVLAFVMGLFGTDSVVALQFLNYIFWVLATWFIYRALKNIGSTSSGSWITLMLFSPLFLTFSAKLYSESYAALGTAMLTFGMTQLSKKMNYCGYLALIIGGLILFSTKSIFLLLIPVILIILIYKRAYLGAIWFLIVPILLIPTVLASSGGGRSSYNLAIQVSKAEQSVDEILACIPYYLSYPVGKKILLSYEGVCHQNDPEPSMPRYNQNPYLIASVKRDSGFTVITWITEVTKNPLKYILVVAVSMTNIIFVEGVYPTILLQLPGSVIVIFYIITKIILSLYLWLRILKNARQRSLVWLTPLIYFIIVIGNFPVEPRYFYPLVPYLYFLAGRNLSTNSKRKSDNHQSR